LADDRPTPVPVDDRQRELETRIERLTQQIAEVVNSAGPEVRQEVREYAIGLLKEETELADAPIAPAVITHAARFNPLAVAFLLVLVSLPLLLSVVFAPIGVAILGVAGLMGLWGLVGMLFRR
jgi:hypothetical protein